MVDLSRLAQPNPFAGDTGAIQPAMQAALRRENIADRIEAIVAALADGRLVLAVQAHDRDERSGDENATERSVKESLGIPVRAPNGSIASAAFTDVESQSVFMPASRPVLASASNVASQVLLDSGVLAINPLERSGSSAIFLGRSALYSVVTHEQWISPWNDAELQVQLDSAVAHPLIAGVEISPCANGLVRLGIMVKSQGGRSEAEWAVARLADVIASNEYVRPRLDLVEIVPLRLA